MNRDVLVVVDGDGSVHRAVAEGSPAGAFEVVGCAGARAGFNAACALGPDGLLMAADLPDLPAIWLVEAVRAQPGEVASLPVVVVCSRPDPAARLELLRAGADVVLSGPVTPDEIVAQVRALLAMASRVRTRRTALPAADGSLLVAGDLDRTPIASVLGTLELERRSGELWLTGRGPYGRRLLLTLASGALTGGWLDADPLEPVDALREAIAWDGRRYEFVTGTDQDRPDGCAPLGVLLLEATQPPAPPTWREPDLPEVLDLPMPASRLPLPPPLPSASVRRALASVPAVTLPSPALAHAPGRMLVEAVIPSGKPDPRAEG